MCDCSSLSLYVHVVYVSMYTCMFDMEIKLSLVVFILRSGLRLFCDEVAKVVVLQNMKDFEINCKATTIPRDWVSPCKGFISRSNLSS